MQKTWTDLLGPYTDNCSVDDDMIVQNIRGDQYRVVWQFDSHEKAVACFNAWKTEN